MEGLNTTCFGRLRRMEQVAESVFSLGSRSHNFYLVVEDQQVSVIDAGCIREWSELTGAVAELGLVLGDISGVVATHVHADHLGLGRQMQSEGLPVSVHEADEPRALGTYQGRFGAKATELPLWSIRAWANMLPMMLAGVTSFEPLETVDTFVDGDTLDIPGRPMVIHTPGHTEGHTMFHCASLGILFTGDGLVTMDLLGSRRGPQRMRPVFDLDTAQAGRSLNRVRDIDADLLLPGHGRPWEGSPGRAVELASN